MIALIVFILLMPSVAISADCIFGTSCYCDKVVPVGGALYDASLILCEDFEAPTLHDNVGAGTTSASARGSGGTNAWGPWYDDTSFTNGRGFNAYWNRKYPSSNAGTWSNGEPASPTVGPTCGFGTCWPAEYRLDDLWQGNTNADGGACIDVVKAGSSNTNDEASALGVPDSPGTSDNLGVWDGKQIFGYRVQQSDGTDEDKACGIVGTFTHSSVTEIGVTMAVAYGDNTGSLNTYTDAVPVKHEEFGNANNNVSIETLAMGNVGLRPTAGFPFSPAHFITSQSACNTALSGATVHVGQASCSSVALQIGTNATEYTQSTDWPFGDWGCVRVHKSGMGTSNVTLKIWYGNATTETLVFHMSGFNGSALTNQYYDQMLWNSYMNANSPNTGAGGLTGPWRRWIDNVHIRNGEPVSCAQIGFTGGGGGGSSTPGSMDVKLGAPQLFRVRQ